MGQFQRDPSQEETIRTLRRELAEQKALTISRWGRVPHLAADPASPPDGAEWIRSDTGRMSWRANGITRRADASFGFRAGRTTAHPTTVATATTAQVSFNSIAKAQGGWQTIGAIGETTVWTVPANEGGTFALAAGLSYTSTSLVALVIQVNGTSRTTMGYTASNDRQIGSTIEDLAAGDTVGLVLLNNSGVILTIGVWSDTITLSPFLSVWRISQ